MYSPQWRKSKMIRNYCSWLVPGIKVDEENFDSFSLLYIWILITNKDIIIDR